MYDVACEFPCAVTISANVLNYIYSVIVQWNVCRTQCFKAHLAPELEYYLYLTSVFLFEGRSLGRYIILSYNVVKMQSFGECSTLYVIHVQYVVDNLTAG